MTGVMMSTQQDNSEVAEGHSLADRFFLFSIAQPAQEQPTHPLLKKTMEM
jgi:hypothetical protein